MSAIENTDAEQVVKLGARVRGLMRERDAARDALAPFAAFAESLNEQIPGNFALGIYACGSIQFGPEAVTVENLRRARAALAEQPPTPQTWLTESGTEVTGHRAPDDPIRPALLDRREEIARIIYAKTCQQWRHDTPSLERVSFEKTGLICQGACYAASDAILALQPAVTQHERCGGKIELEGRRARLAETVNLIEKALEAGRSLASIFPLENDALPRAIEIVERRRAILNTACYEFKTTFCHDLAVLTTAPVADRAMISEIPFDPTNHHNALKCPYCNPKGLVLVEAVPIADRAAVIEGLAEFSDFINEPPQYEDKRMVRDYRHELARKWIPLLEKIRALADAKGDGE